MKEIEEFENEECFACNRRLLERPCGCESADDCKGEEGCQMKQIFAEWGRPQ